MTSDICIKCIKCIKCIRWVFWIIYLINEILKNTSFRKQVWTTLFKKSFLMFEERFANLVVISPSIFYWILIIMNYTQYSCTYSYFLLSHSLSIASERQKIRGLRVITGETVKDDVTIKWKSMDANKRSLSLCMSFPTVPISH